jgi:hypothetical protein
VTGVIWWLGQRYMAWRRRRRPLGGKTVLTGVSPFDESGVLTVGGKIYRYRRQSATSVVLSPMRPWNHAARLVRRWRFRLRYR